MKKLIALLLAAVLLLSLAACQASNPGGKQVDADELSMEMGQTHTDYEGIEVQIANATWGENGFVLDVNWINDTKYDAIYGASYIVERYENGEWVSCAKEGEHSFIAIAYELAAHKTNKETYKVSGMFDVSKAGTYRFRSDCYVSESHDSSVKVSLWAEFTLSENFDGSEVKTHESVEYGVQYIRTNGYQDGASFPRVEIIRSAEELNSYYEANKDTFDLERKDQVYSDTTIGFLDACDKYDTAYFEKGYLVFVLLEEGSGSIRHEVQETTISSDGELGVYIVSDLPGAGTCDMAEWHIILEMSNAVEVKDEASVQVFLDGRLAYDKGTVETPVSGTPNATIFKEPPAAKLLHGNGSTPVSTAGYDWTYPVGDGTMSATIVDAQNPLYCQDTLAPVYVTGEYVKLAFEDDPDSIEIQCWPDTAWNSSTVESEEVNCYGTAFDIKQGGYIYLITARWNESETSHYGSVDYYAYIVAGEEHTHQTASEPQTVDDPVEGYCGNTMTTIYLDGEAVTFMYDESVTLTNILINLAYDPEKVCDCLPEYTVDTEFGKGYGINLAEGYVRCEKGQADLTAGQIDQIAVIIEWARENKSGR